MVGNGGLRGHFELVDSNRDGLNNLRSISSKNFKREDKVSFPTLKRGEHETFNCLYCILLLLRASL